MIVSLRRLYSRSARSRGLAVDEDGAVLGPDCVLVQRTPQGYRCTDRAEAAAIQRIAYGAERRADWLFDQCSRIAEALNDKQVALAQIYGVHAVPDDLDEQHVAKLAATAPLLRANFNPDQPRVPAGNPDGGQWTTEDNGESTAGTAGSSTNDAEGGASSGAGGDESPSIEYTIPAEAPDTPQERNSILRQSAEWLRHAAAVGAAIIPDSRVRAFLRLLEATAWVVEYLPEIRSYLDEPKSLDELQDTVNYPRAGYQNHHIVETQYNSTREDSNAIRFGDRLEGRDNVVRIPYWKHVEISSWYSRRNDQFDWQTPREYLRGKNWDEQYRFGLDALRRFGVLK